MFTIIRKIELTHSVPVSRGEANLLAEGVKGSKKDTFVFYIGR